MKGVVNNITREFARGKFYAIMGKSGSGKTTLLSLMAGLMLPTKGQILIDGISTSELNRNQLRRDRISVIYQDYNLFPLLTVEENVEYPLCLRGQKGEKNTDAVRECLKAVDISEEQFKARPVTLSGGEQQRVAIARALITGSELILADEPTGSLDTANTGNIVKILGKIAHEEGRCVIIVTHDPAVSQAADVVLHMQDGELSLS
ncbi:MAG: ABC transporter ATP-binding protein, partial [Acetatifactor sp.]|nr:ABC transporter ATP-binding protein [Acetatifactor sp.]